MRFACELKRAPFSKRITFQLAPNERYALSKRFQWIRKRWKRMSETKFGRQREWACTFFLFFFFSCSSLCCTWRFHDETLAPLELLLARINQHTLRSLSTFKWLPLSVHSMRSFKMSLKRFQKVGLQVFRMPSSAEENALASNGRWSWTRAAVKQKQKSTLLPTFGFERWNETRVKVERKTLRNSVKQKKKRVKTMPDTLYVHGANRKMGIVNKKTLRKKKKRGHALPSFPHDVV